MINKGTSGISFTEPSIYKIKVKGALNESWSERLGGMQINVERSREDGPITVLVGRINDQSALSGILNSLYESHLTIISVYMLKDENL